MKMRDLPLVTVEEHQPRLIPAFGGIAGNELRRELIVVIGSPETHSDKSSGVAGDQFRVQDHRSIASGKD
jgi:hypothetical protein